MNYVKINDETKYIYGMIQRFFRPSPLSAFPRDAAKEKELYGLKDTFHKARPNGDDWKNTIYIHMFDSRSGIRYMLYGFTNNHKNALVAAQYRTQDTLHFALPETPVFCYQESLSKVPYIVFSDNPIFAEAIQRHLERESSWSATSFLQKSDLKDLDFSVFSGKTVIYYLVEHSGDDWRTSCLNALDIIDRFPEDTTVYVMSYPETNNCPDIAKYPVFLSTKQQFEEEVEELKKQPAFAPSVNWSNPLPLERKQIAAGILGQTLTWIYDANAAFRTQYLTHWAAAISAGKANIQTYQEVSPCNIAYFYINEFDDGFTSGLQAGFETVFDSKFSEAALPQAPASVLDAYWKITESDLFLSYPVTDNPFLQTPNNFHYTALKVHADSTHAAIKILISYIKNFEKYHPDTQIIVLDIPAFWTLGISLANLAQFLYDLRSRYSVILATNIPIVKQRDLIRNLPFDKIIKLQRKSDTPEATNIDLVFERDDIENKIHTVRLTRNSQDKIWKYRAVRKLSVKEKIQFIKQHKDMELKKIAIALGISESYVKKLRGLAGVSKKVPNRAPKHPKRKPVEYSH